MAGKKSLGKSSALSAEYIIDSDSDGVTESPTRTQEGAPEVARNIQPKKKPNKAGTPSSGSGSGLRPSRSNDPIKSKITSTQNKRTAESESSSNEERTGRKRSAEATAERQKTKTVSVPKSSVVEIPAKSFRPPHGFRDVGLDASDFSADVIEAFASGSKGKQVWHVTAPASIPLDSIREFEAEAVLSGAPILTHQGKKYGFSTQQYEHKQTILPERNNSTYLCRKPPISKSYQLREISSLSKLADSQDRQSSSTVSFFADAKPESRRPPKQLETLKSRYKPFGMDDVPSNRTSFTRNLISAKENAEAPSPLPSPPQEHTPKKRKKRSDAHSSRQKDVVAPDYSMDTDRSPSQATVQASPSQVSHHDAGGSKNADGVNYELVTVEKKKRKKKKPAEMSSWA